MIKRNLAYCKCRSIPEKSIDIVAISFPARIKAETENCCYNVCTPKKL